MYIGAKSVKPLKDYRLLITFENGEQRIFDVTPYLTKGMFAQLKDPAVFNSVHISFDTVEWSNGVDICPETLFKESMSLEESKAGSLPR
jgi:hypothetical protein